MAIADHQIQDIDSFNTATSDAHRVAGLYFYFKLDALIDLAHKVSQDFFDRPELFTDLAGDSATLAGLHGRYGSEEGFLNKQQRGAIYAALFGRSASMDASEDEEGNFPNLRDELLEACSTFVETKFGDEDSLRENVRQKHRLLKEYLTGLSGDSVTWSREGALAGLTEDVCYRILRNKGVSAVYGVAKEPRHEWPYTFDSNADKLIEEISKQLMVPQKLSEQSLAQARTDGQQEIFRYISREEITNRQRAAIEGARAIAAVIDYSEGGPDDIADIGKVITRCYTWGTALKNLRNYPRAYLTSLLPGIAPRAGEKTRGGLALAQPMPGATQ